MEGKDFLNFSLQELGGVSLDVSYTGYSLKPGIQQHTSSVTEAMGVDTSEALCATTCKRISGSAISSMKP